MHKLRREASLVFLLTISMFLTIASHGLPLSALAGSPLANISYLPGRIVVKFKEGVSPDSKAEVHARYGAVVEEEIPEIGVQILSVSSGEVEATIAAYQAEPSVEYAEPDYITEPAY